MTALGCIAPIEAVAFVGALVQEPCLKLAAETALEKCVDRACGLIQDGREEDEESFHRNLKKLEQVYLRCVSYLWTDGRLHVPEIEDFSDEDRPEESGIWNDSNARDVFDEVFPDNPGHPPTKTTPPTAQYD